jgi:hypothetical protein
VPRDLGRSASAPEELQSRRSGEVELGGRTYMELAVVSAGIESILRGIDPFLKINVAF